MTLEAIPPPRHHPEGPDEVRAAAFAGVPMEVSGRVHRFIALAKEQVHR